MNSKRNVNKLWNLKLPSDLLMLAATFLYANYTVGFDTETINLRPLPILIIVWLFSAKVTESYQEFRAERYITELLKITQNCFIQFLTIGQIYFFISPLKEYRDVAIIYSVIAFLVIVIKNYIIKKIYLRIRTNGRDLTKVVFIGYDSVTSEFIEKIQENKQYGYKIMGVISDTQPPLSSIAYLGTFTAFKKSNFPSDLADEFIFTNQKGLTELNDEVINFAESNAVRLKVLHNIIDQYQTRFQSVFIGKYTLTAFRKEPLKDAYWLFTKRTFDILFSLFIILLILSWLLPIITLIIRFNSKGNVFYVQDRWGENNRRFKCIKLRTMRAEANPKQQFTQTVEGDKRITPIGKFLRKFSIDELPQFFNVLVGDMSVVGPRPHAHEHNLQTKDKIEKYLVRHWVKPGITGWAQVNGYRGETKTIESMQQRVNFDIWYIENWTFLLDIKIVLMTIYNLLRGDRLGS